MADHVGVACPWCGKSALGTKLIGSGSAMYPYSYAVACRTCGAQGPRRPTPEGAEAAWNERKEANHDNGV